MKSNLAVAFPDDQQNEDWSRYEVSAEDVKPAELEPEKDAELLIAADPETQEKALATYKGRVELLVPKDEETVKACAIFVDQCKAAAKRVEDERVALVQPLNDEVKKINGPRILVRDAFLAMGKAVTARVNKFLDDRKKAAEIEQQRINAEAAAKQAELDRKAAEARAKAAEAAAAGDETTAIKLESKANQLEQKAAEVVPEQAALPSNKVELETSTVSFNGPKKVWSLAGWDKKKPLPILSPSLAPLVGDFQKLPEGIRFLLQHADLNPVRLNASYKGGSKFPAPFSEVNDYSGSTSRS